MTAQKINIGLTLGDGGAMNNLETLQNPNLLQVLERAEQITSTRLGERKQIRPISPSIRIEWTFFGLSLIKYIN